MADGEQHLNLLRFGGANFVILRPDFYGAATATDSVQLQRAVDQILSGLHLAAQHQPVPALA